MVARRVALKKIRGQLAPLALLALWSPDGLAQVAGQPDPRDIERMGAFQCIVCPLGGFLEGIRAGGFGRIHEDFSAFKQLCIASYDYAEGELFVRFTLDGGLWPGNGEWGVKASSWAAECRPGTGFD